GSESAAGAELPKREDLEAIDGSPVRCFDSEAGERMVGGIDTARRAGDSLGGVFEVLAYGAPPGLGSHVQFDRKLDARLALALMSIQSVKGVGIGDGFASAEALGSEAHDEIVADGGGRPRRVTGRAGGTEGGM